MSDKHYFIICLANTICNCILGGLAIVAICLLARFFGSWWILFFLILPMGLCTNVKTIYFGGDDSDDMDTD